MHSLRRRSRRKKRGRDGQTYYAGSPLERAERVLAYPKFMMFEKEPRGSAYQLAPLPSSTEIQLQAAVKQDQQLGWISEILRLISEIKCISASTPPAKVIFSAMIIQRKFRVIRFKRKMTEKWNVLVSFRYMVEHFAALKIQCFVRKTLARWKVNHIRFLWHQSNAVKLQCLARQHLAINRCKRLHAKNLMVDLKTLIPGGKISRILIMGQPHMSQVSFSNDDTKRLQAILFSIFERPKDIVWSELLQNRKVVSGLIERNRKRKLILQERHRVAKSLGNSALKFIEEQRLVRAETGKKVLALRYEIEENRKLARERTEREEREIMWREDQRMARKNRLRTQLHDVASAIASVTCDQAIYLVGNCPKRSKNSNFERNLPTGPNEMTYLL